MIRISRWVTIFLSLMVLAAVIEPWLVGRRYSHDEAFIGWIARSFGESSFPWIGGMVLGLTAGLWMEWLGQKFERRTEQEAEAIGIEMRKLRTLYHSRERGWITTDSKAMDSRDYVADGLGILGKASKLGLAIPYPSRFEEMETKIIAIDNYFRMVAPPLIAGDLKLAKSTAFAASHETFEEMQFP